MREFIIDDARYTRKIEEKYIEINRLEEIETGRETLFLTIEHAVTSCSIVIVNPYEEGGEHVRFDNARKRKIAGRSIIRLVLNQEQSRRFISGRSRGLIRRNETKRNFIASCSPPVINLGIIGQDKAARVSLSRETINHPSYVATCVLFIYVRIPASSHYLARASGLDDIKRTSYKR